MRQTILLISVLLLSVKGLGQNYRPVQQGVNRFFINNTGYLRGMRIDSVTSSTGSTNYYPFKTFRGYYLQTNLTPKGSWLGETIQEFPDGLFLFDNMWQDTVVIKTHAVLNDNWILYDDASTVHYEATVTSIDTMTLLGILDSVKRITVTAYDNSQILTTDPINNAEIILSKEHGFVKVMDLYTFPYHEPGQVYSEGFDYFVDYLTYNTGTIDPEGIEFSLVNFILPNGQEIYDLDEGDVFSYHHMNVDDLESWWKDSIMTKTTSGNQYSYSIHRQRVDQQMGITTYTNSVIQQSYGFTQWLDTSIIPEECASLAFTHYRPWDSSFCLHTPWYSQSSNYISPNGEVNTLFQCGAGISIKERFGMVYTFQCYDPIPGGGEFTALQYSKKNNLPCGSLPDILGLGDLAKELQVNIYPNPAQDRLHLNNTQFDVLDLSVTNIYGQVIATATLEKGEINLNTSGWAAGIYIITLIDANGHRSSKKIEVVH